jgi:uncharacterized membrane protein
MTQSGHYRDLRRPGSLRLVAHGTEFEADSVILVDPGGASTEKSRRDGSLTCPGPRLCLGDSHLYAGGCSDACARRIWGIVLAVAAVGEYVVDLLPNTPSRTQAMGLSARVVSGAFVGWMIATMHDGSGMFGAIAGIAGAVIGTYAGHPARLAAIDRIGGYPAAIVEDLVAIGLAAFIVTR